MKKFLLAGVLFSVLSLSAGAIDFGVMQSSNNPQLRLLQQQEFRKEEYNEFKDMKEVKENRNKKLEYEQRIKNPKKPLDLDRDVQFINENGQVKIQRVD